MKILFTILILTTIIYSEEEFYFPDSLSDSQKVFLDSVVNEISIDDGCKGSIGETKNSIACPEAKSFYNFAAWFVMNEKPADYIVDKMRRHNDTYFKPEKFDIVPSELLSIAGDTSSPIQIIAYITSTCPHCKKVGIPLQEMVKGPLLGQASFAIKPIHHKIGDYALLAAANQGKDWELFIALGDIHERIDENTVLEAAEAAGIDVDKLKKDVEDNNELYQKIISENYKEAKRNGMNFTPALYFNGFRYRSNKHPLWLLEYIKYLTRTGKLQD